MNLNEIESSLKGISPWLYGVLVGLAVTFWSRIKQFLLKLLNLFFINIHFNTDISFEVFLLKMIKDNKLKRSIFSDDSIKIRHCYYKPVKKRSAILFWDYMRGETSLLFLWKYVIPIIISVENNGSKEGAKSVNRGQGITGFSIRTLRFVPLQLWLNQWQSELISQKERHFAIVDLSGARQNPSSLNNNLNKEPVEDESSFQDLVTFLDPIFVDSQDLQMPIGDTKTNFYNSDAILKFYEDLKFFYDSKEWYEERKLSYRRGYVLHGLPGTGKSTYVRIIAEEFDIPIYRFDLATMSNNEFKKSWNKAVDSQKLKIVLIEDFHAVFNGRENITNLDGIAPGVSFDCFLNTTDGIQKEDNFILVITTNDLSCMDSALYVAKGEMASRPGRIDMAFEFGYLDHKGKEFIANIILRGFPNDILEVVNSIKDCTAAQFEELCKRRAKEIYIRLNRTKSKEKYEFNT